MQDIPKMIGYRPTPETEPLIRKAVSEGPYISPQHAISDALIRVHGPVLAPPPVKGLRHDHRKEAKA